mgnify:CR=1 FL=1
MNERKILAVSSDPSLLSLLQDSLPARGYQITSAKDTGEELKTALSETLPDLIILDIMMPYLDGIEICLRLRQRSQIPILMLSTWGTRKGTVKTLDLSADSYLSEPFTISELIARIEQILSQDTALEDIPMNHTERDREILQTGYCCYNSELDWFPT